MYVDMRVHVTFDVVEAQEWHVVFLLWLTPRLHHTVLLIFLLYLMYPACDPDLAASILSILILLQLLQ